MMLFIFVCLSICHQVYDFTTNYPDILTLYFNPLETVEIIVRKRLGVFLSTWNDYGELHLEVEAGDKGGTIDKYGPFGSESGLAGVYFKTKNFTLKFKNEGADRARIGLMFDYDRFPSRVPSNYRYDYTFPIFAQGEVKLTSLTNPFIYYLEEKNNDEPVIILCAVLGTFCMFGMCLAR